MATADQKREYRNLRAEVYRLAERNENLTRYIEVVERKLEALLENSGPPSPVVTIEDAIARTGDQAS